MTTSDIARRGADVESAQADLQIRVRFAYCSVFIGVCNPCQSNAFRPYAYGVHGVVLRTLSTVPGSYELPVITHSR
jgi:hypothetical protein